MTISMKRLALAGGIAVSALALSTSAHAEGWTGGYISVGVSGASSSADVSASAKGDLTKVIGVTSDVINGATPNKLNFASSADTGTTSTFTLKDPDPSANAPVQKHVLSVVSEVLGKTNNRFRAGLIIEGGYDYEIANSLVLGLNASYTFSGTATSNDVASLGNVSWTKQGGTLTAAGTVSGLTVTAPNITATALGTSTLLTDLTAAGTFVPTPDETSTTTPQAAIAPVLQQAGAIATTARFRMGDNWAVGGRVGFAASSNILLFVAGGYTQAKVGVVANSSVYSTNAGDSVAAAVTKLVSLKEVSGSKWRDGYYVGGGFEAKVTSNISLKAEYRYSDYGNYSVASKEDVAVGASAFGLKVPVTTTVSAKNIQSHALRVSVGYRF